MFKTISLPTLINTVLAKYNVKPFVVKAIAIAKGIRNIIVSSCSINIFLIAGSSNQAIAAVLLIMPGFFTDFIGFLILIPFTRKILFSLVLKNKTKIDEKPESNTIDGEVIDNKKDEL